MFVFRAMGPVATQALHRYVVVSRIPELVANGMGRVFLPVMAGPAEVDCGCLFEKVEIVGSMGIVARTAFAVFDRLMLGH